MNDETVNNTSNDPVDNAAAPAPTDPQADSHAWPNMGNTPRSLSRPASLSVVATTPDRALETLAEAVATIKGDQPLRPVTIIVATNAAGVMARRSLAQGAGVAAIDIVTVSRLAERLAGPTMASQGRAPVSSPVIELVVRSVLQRQPGSFGAVATHSSTIEAVRELYQQLRQVGPDALERLAASSGRGREVARVARATAELLASEWYDEGDLLAAAIDAVEIDGVPGASAVITFLPQTLPGLAADLVAAVGRAVPTTLIVPFTAVDAIDADTQHSVESLGGEMFDSTLPPPRVAPTTVVSTTDADDEVRQAVHAIVDAARDGVAFARIALLWPTDEPYARLVQHHLDAANIAWNGRPGTQVSERLVPRFLLDMLALDRHDLRRNDLFDLLSDLPLRTRDGAAVPVARWERIARRAGVQRGDQWADRLDRYATSERAKADEADNERRAKVHQRNAAEADRLASFVAALQRDLSRTPRSWNEWADWCEQQLDLRLGRSTLEGLIEGDRLAFEHTNRVLDRLRTLDTLALSPSASSSSSSSSPPSPSATDADDAPQGHRVRRADFRAVFAAEFDAAPGRLGRLGDGVTVGSITGTIPLDSDLTIVLGAVEGLLPPPPLIDPLLSDHDRAAAGLPTSERRSVRAHLGFVSALATAGRVVIGVPRGDLRTSTERVPSRWLSEHIPDADTVLVASHHQGLARLEFPAGGSEFRLRRALLAAQRAIEERPSAIADLAATTDDDALTRGLTMRSARRSDAVTEFDGDLSEVGLTHFDRPVSASQLEAWVKCPHAYFMRYHLGVYPIDESVDALSVSPIDYGNVLHETIDRFNKLVLAGELDQPTEQGWTKQHQSALVDLFDEVADEYERLGRTGKPASWELDRPAAKRDLLVWFVRDGQLLAARHATIFASEHRFGGDGTVTLAMPDGERIAVQGFVDRIDRSSDGRLFVVDHKTGSDSAFSGLSDDDPTAWGEKMQLPTYAAAALALTSDERPAGDAAPMVQAEYGFFSRSKPPYARKGYALRPDTWTKVGEGLSRTVGGIRSGLYPPVTGPPKFQFYVQCEYCEPDHLGTAERWEEWSRKQLDPRIRPYFDNDGTNESTASDEGHDAPLPTNQTDGGS